MPDDETSAELELEMQRMLSGGIDAFGNKRGFSLQAIEEEQRMRHKLLLMLAIPVILFLLAYYFG
jgi:hypothetical protein